MSKVPGVHFEPVMFPHGAITLAGDLRTPEGHDRRRPLPAVVIATPGSSVKEQIGANYAERLTAMGFATLTFDPAYQGRSGGAPRDLEDPAARVEDIRCAVDHLVTLPFIDEHRIGLIGVCAGGGYAVAAAKIEHRIKALATVVPVNIGRARRQSGGTPDAVRETLEAVGRQRTLVARGGAAKREKWIPDTLEEARAAGLTDPDLLDAIDYYRTPRGYSEHASNRRDVTSLAPMLDFDAFHLVGELLTQPLQVIVAGRLGATFSYADGLTLYERANNRDSFHVVKGAGHYDMYDKSPRRPPGGVLREPPRPDLRRRPLNGSSRIEAWKSRCRTGLPRTDVPESPAAVCWAPASRRRAMSDCSAAGA